MQTRRVILEVGKVPRPFNRSTRPQQPQSGWKILETKVKGTAAVQVSVLPLRVPRYSFKVGSAQFDEKSGEVRLSPFVTIFNYEDAADLLIALGKKYHDMRESKIDEVEALKEKWQQEHGLDVAGLDGPLEPEGDNH